MNINATNSAIGVHHPTAQRSAEPRATQQHDTVSISGETRFRNAQALAERRAAQTESQPRESLRSLTRNPRATGPAGIG